MLDGAELWTSCQQLRILRKAIHWQPIQNLVPFTIVWRQCDIWIGHDCRWHESATCWKSKVNVVWLPNDQPIFLSRRLFTETMKLLTSRTPNGFDLEIETKSKIRTSKNTLTCQIVEAQSNHSVEYFQLRPPSSLYFMCYKAKSLNAASSFGFVATLST